jgi:hypothetical protein
MFSLMSSVRDQVDGARLHLWPATTNGPIVHSHIIYEYGEPWLKDVDRGKLPIRPPKRSVPILPAEPPNSKSGGSRRRRKWILYVKYFFHTRRVILYIVKILRRGASGFTFLPKEGALRIFIALKNPSPRPGLNPRTLGPMASTLTITPPTQLVSACQ